MRKLLPAVVAVIAALPCRPAAAHEYWLASSRFQGARGDTVSVGAFVGTGFQGEVKPWTPRRCRRFELRGVRAMDLSRAGVNGEAVWAKLLLPDAGGAVIVYESDFAFIEMESTKFDEYLRAEGLDGPLSARQGAAARPGRERYARCCKTWITGREPRRLSEPAGLKLEIVPLADPDSVSMLPLRVLFEGRPLPNVLVRSWCAGESPPSPAARDSIAAAGEARTDAAGRAILRCERSGEWLVNAVHMVPCTTPEADWESWWTSLTFARSAPPAAQRATRKAP
jgi:uncharacterized GH25 family protein